MQRQPTNTHRQLDPHMGLIFRAPTSATTAPNAPPVANPFVPFPQHTQQPQTHRSSDTPSNNSAQQTPSSTVSTYANLVFLIPPITPIRVTSLPAPQPAALSRRPTPQQSTMPVSATMQQLLLKNYLTSLPEPEFNALVLSLASIYPSLASAIANEVRRTAQPVPVAPTPEAPRGMNPNAPAFQPPTSSRNFY